MSDVAVPRVSIAAWRLVEHDDPAFAVELPAAPAVIPSEDGAGMLVVQLGDRSTYSVIWNLADAAGRWLSLQTSALLGRGRVLADEHVSSTERRCCVELPGGLVETSRVVVADGRGYMIIAVAPPGVDVEPFLRSFVAR